MHDFTHTDQTHFYYDGERRARWVQLRFRGIWWALEVDFESLVAILEMNCPSAAYGKNDYINSGVSSEFIPNNWYIVCMG